MNKELVINALSPYQHKAVQIPKGWDFKVEGSPLIPSTGVTMKLHVGNNEPVDIPFRLGVSSVIVSLKGLKVKEFIIEYFHSGKRICMLGCKQVRDHVESKPIRHNTMF